MNAKKIKEVVQQRYAAIAQGADCQCSPHCCSVTTDLEDKTIKESPAIIASRLVDYGDFQLDIDSEADLGLGCGVPTLSAGIKPGDRVLDLGSGAGVDVFLAARVVGPHGQVIGVDMTPEMIIKARDNAMKKRYRNVEFRLGELEDLPVSSGSVDVVISNCVINLVPDKTRVFSEIYRALKPAGHFSISDMVTYGDVPHSVREDMELWASCINGAMDRDEYLSLIRQSGFREIYIKNFSEYDAYKGTGFGIASITVEAYKV